MCADNGGHGMIFRRSDGGLGLTYHQPNTPGRERTLIPTVIEPPTAWNRRMTPKHGTSRTVRTPAGLEGKDRP
jgi:hypothetical protein